jgi:hypothetical protein
MTLFSLAVAATQAAGGSAPPPPAGAQAGAEGGPAAVFLGEERAVSNWRAEALRDLQPRPLSAAAVALGVERPVISRCVKLNNYWCIKSARWNGEIGTDDEGHVGFASAEHGADAAVRLLRRYYLDLERKSALDIVRRWAPAECRVASSSSAPAVLAVRGLGNTLRARWLAARRTIPARTKVAAAGAAVPVRAARGRVSAVPLAPLPTVKVPDIMTGASSTRPVTLSATLAPRAAPPRRQPTPASVAAAKARSGQRTASAPSTSAAVPPPRPATVAAAATAASPPRPAPTSLCGGDEQRIQNYAARMVHGLDLQPGDDLKLFDDDGRPLPNLARVLLAMSSFELGYLGAAADLVEAAIERATPAPVPPQPQAAPAEPVL